jgi:glycosyltransferase involved in cell wall biosynthesis
MLADELYPLAEFPGAVHGPDLEPYYSTADLFVLPGTGGLAVQEAMAHGLPVVVATGDGTQSDLVRPENGWNVADGDAAALAQVLEVALKDPARLRAMGDESFRIARDEINLEKMVEVFVRALNQTLHSRTES